MTPITGQDSALLESFYSEWLKEHGTDNSAVFENEMKEFRLAIDNFEINRN